MKSKLVNIQLTQDQTRTIIDAVEHWSKVIDLTNRGLTDEEQAHNAFVDRLLVKLAQAVVTAQSQD